VIEPFLPVIEARGVATYFFGGGTPSLIRAGTMREVFRLFPGMGRAPSKTFEIHAAIWDEAQLDVLAEFNFDCAIVGIQSFDEAVLRRQNRLHAPVEKVRALAADLKERGIAVATDIIYHMDAINVGAIFAQDLQDLLSVDFDIVCLQHSFDNVRNDDQLDEFYGIIEHSSILDRYRREWAHHSKHFTGHHLPPRRVKKKLKAIRLIDKTIDIDDYHTWIFPLVKAMDEASTVQHLPTAKRISSVLGFGSYKNPRKNTFSHIYRKDKTIESIEVNNNWQPEYYTVYEQHAHDRFARIASLLDRLEAVGKTPEGVEISLLNEAYAAKEHSVYHRPESTVGVALHWKSTPSPAVSRLIDKIKNRFPNHVEFANREKFGNGLLIGEEGKIPVKDVI